MTLAVFPFHQTMWKDSTRRTLIAPPQGRAGLFWGIILVMVVALLCAGALLFWKA
jgi:hypothetical protein